MPLKGPTDSSSNAEGSEGFAVVCGICVVFDICEVSGILDGFFMFWVRKHEWGKPTNVPGIAQLDQLGFCLAAEAAGALSLVSLVLSSCFRKFQP